MAESERIFVDSNYFIAFYNTADSLHQEALDKAKLLVSNSQPILISNFIFLETVTILSQRSGRVSALEVGRHLLESPLIEIIYVDQSIQGETWKIFQAVGQKNISFADCSTIAVMKAEGISKLLTFDEDFKKLSQYHQFSFY